MFYDTRVDEYTGLMQGSALRGLGDASEIKAYLYYANAVLVMANTWIKALVAGKLLPNSEAGQINAELKAEFRALSVQIKSGRSVSGFIPQLSDLFADNPDETIVQGITVPFPSGLYSGMKLEPLAVFRWAAVYCALPEEVTALQNTASAKDQLTISVANGYIQRNNVKQYCLSYNPSGDTTTTPAPTPTTEPVIQPLPVPQQTALTYSPLTFDTQAAAEAAIANFPAPPSGTAYQPTQLNTGGWTLTAVPLVGAANRKLKKLRGFGAFDSTSVFWLVGGAALLYCLLKKKG